MHEFFFLWLNFFACLCSEINESKLKVVNPNKAQLAGREFFAGYLAFKDKTQILGKRKHEAELDDEFCSSAWLNKINYGGLIYAKKDLVKDIGIMDKMFVEYNMSSTDGLLRTKNIIKDFTEMLKEKFGEKYDEKLLKRFALCRHIFRMRWLQQQLAAKTAETLRSVIKCISYRY